MPGALLSAVTIDIVAPAVELGEFGWLAFGAVVGGLVFEGLNRTINARGGFLRKASTSITFLRDREQRRRRQILDDLERIEIFDGLPDRELDAIAKAFRTVRLDAGETLYRHGDPCDHLNVLADGEVVDDDSRRHRPAAPLPGVRPPGVRQRHATPLDGDGNSRQRGPAPQPSPPAERAGELPDVRRPPRRPGPQ